MAIRQDLGAVSAYAIAVEQGYTGTEEEWIAELSSTTQNAETATAKALDSEAYALGTRDGSAVSSDDPAYHNNSKYYAEKAPIDAVNASKPYAETSEAYAIGKRDGTDVPSTDPTYHNNSKYYAEQAEASAQQAASYKATLDSNGIIIF